MAREFDGSTQYLSINSSIVSGYPLTFSIWFNRNVVGGNKGLMTIEDVGGAFSVSLGTNSSAFVVTWTTPGPVACSALGTWSFSTWTHACGIVHADRSLTTYRDGANKVTNPGPAPVWDVGADTTYIAEDTVGPWGLFPGALGEAAIYDVDLTDEEVAGLALRYSPLHIRPQNLVAYWPLVRDQDYDIVGGNNMSATGSPTIRSHPAVTYPATLAVPMFSVSGGSSRRTMTTTGAG